MKAELLEYLRSADLSNISMEDVAKHFGVSKNVLGRATSSDGMRYKQCLSQVRMERIKMEPRAAALGWAMEFGMEGNSFRTWYFRQTGNTWGQREAA